MRKTSIIIALALSMVITVGYSTTNDKEIDSLKNRIAVLETEIEIKTNIISDLETELMRANEALLVSEPNYNRISIEEKNEFTSYILNNPVDKEYLKDYHAILDSKEVVFSDMYYLEHSYKRLWEIEMEYAFYRIYPLVGEDEWDYIEMSQDNFVKCIENIEDFIYEAFTKNEYEIADDITQIKYFKNLYKNRTIELLEYLYILEEWNKPMFLFEVYSEDKSIIDQALAEINVIYWQDLETLLPLEHKLATLGPDGIKIFKLHGYELIHKDERYLRKFSVDSIDIYDMDNNLIQSIEVPNTLVPSGRLFDYGFKIDDWNFDGSPDISLFAIEGGTMKNAPTYFWLWDNEVGMFISNELLNEYSQTSYLYVDSDAKEVVCSYYAEGYHKTYYSWQDSDLIPLRHEGHSLEKDDNGEMLLYYIKEIYEEGEWIEIEKTLAEE